MIDFHSLFALHLQMLDSQAELIPCAAPSARQGQAIVPFAPEGQAFGLWSSSGESRKYDGTPLWLKTSWMTPQQTIARRRTSAYHQEVPISCIKAESSDPIGRASNRFSRTAKRGKTAAS
jgi:hypothetical protein